MRHIIVEGPDGAGKTTLITRILNEFPRFVAHERAVESDGSRVPHLDRWVTEDAGRMPTAPMSVYDRHAIISEPIYGLACRGGKFEGMFRQPWWINATRARVSLDAVLIMCLPPLSYVRQNVNDPTTEQMAGVVANIDAVWHGYHSLPWPGVMMRYDYTSTITSTTIQVIRGIFNGQR